MGWFYWPYSNMHELNLDWIINRVKELDTTVSDVLGAEYGLAAVESVHSNIDSYTQAELQALYDKGTNIIVSKDTPAAKYNNVLWIITKHGDVYSLTPYRPDTAAPGVLSVNGLTGDVRLSADHIPIYTGVYNSVYERIRQNERVHNIIDNGYFRDPVNQRGKWGSNLTAGYTMDRWRLDGNGGLVYTRHQYVTVTGSDLTQYIAEPYNRGVVTLVVKVYDDDTPYYCVLDTANNGTASCDVATVTRADTFLAVQLHPAKSYEWAALYEHLSVNDVATVPVYVPKGYTAELAECQRYYNILTAPSTPFDVVLSGMLSNGTRTIVAATPIPTMRLIEPTCTITGTIIARGVSGYIGQNLAVTVRSAYNPAIGYINLILEQADATDFAGTANTPVQVSLTLDSMIEISADL